MKFIGIIPSRYASSRFPGKPLAMIGGMSMIERVYRRASMELDEVYVATDDSRIYDAVKAFGGKVVMTSDKHRSGTDRCREAYHNIGSDADVVINIQGDEPFISPRQIALLKSCFDDPDVEIATLAREFDPALGIDALFNANTPKLVMDSEMNAIYFSRSVIPYYRDISCQDWLDHGTFYTHVGLYAYRAGTLDEITTLGRSKLELVESLEQLRWIENGYKIRVAITDCATIGIDTPDDLENAIKHLDDFDLHDA